MRNKERGDRLTKGRHFVWGLPCLGRLSGLAEGDVDWRCVGWMRRGHQDIRHKARASGNKSEESAVTGIESDAAVNWIPAAELLAYALTVESGGAAAGRSASASARKEEGGRRDSCIDADAMLLPWMALWPCLCWRWR